MAIEVTYNLFRQGRDPAVVCAVPNDKPVPGFIRGPAWVFDTTIALDSDPADGFDPRLAQTATNANGFYLFVASGRAEAEYQVIATEMRAAA
jgi:hypothetical protein